MTRCCERCTGMENVKEFVYNSREDRDGSERLCWDCRWPYIQERIHPELQDDYEEPEPEPERPSGQTGLTDYI